MRHLMGASFVRRAFLRKIDRVLRHVRFSESALSSQRLDDVPVAIATGEIHVGVHIRRIAPKNLLNRAERLDEFLPINPTKQTHTDNSVTNRDLVGSLILTLLIKQLFDGQALFAQSLFEPATRQMKRGIETGKTRA